MKIWIDGDACPKAIKQVLFRAATRRNVQLFIVANHAINIPPSVYIKRIIVQSGFDSADNYIVEQVEKHDLVITADIILADHIVSKQAFALNPRGTLYTNNNIKQILTLRNFNESLRETGHLRGGADKFSAKEVQAFSNHLDKIINQFHDPNG